MRGRAQPRRLILVAGILPALAVLAIAALAITPAPAGAKAATHKRHHTTSAHKVQGVLAGFQVDLHLHLYADACALGTSNFRTQLVQWANAGAADGQGHFTTCAGALPTMIGPPSKPAAQIKAAIAKLPVQVHGDVATMLSATVGFIYTGKRWLVAKYGYVGND